jgi:tRNA U34 2-thiouridine synthase MnmA/TrmU
MVQTTADSKTSTVQAIGLCSGGLDSMLAGLILRRLGVEVEWVCFETPFFSAAKARRASQLTGIPLTVQPIYPIYVQMLRNPRAGYGKYMNPCMDCHTLMFRLAGEMMKAKGFDFLFSGEVLGQRPMSQTRTSLRYVEKHSGFDGYILRPLSAGRLPVTIPEQNGWVNRDHLLDIAGRSRKRQMQLAKDLGITGYPPPAGGCLLTDRAFSKRLRDLLDHKETCSEEEMHLLKYGRHFRINSQTKLIVGRTEDDNKNILKYHNPATDTVIDIAAYPSPIALITPSGSREAVLLGSAVCAGYSKAPKLTPVKAMLTRPEGEEMIEVIALPPRAVRHLMV